MNTIKNRKLMITAAVAIRKRCGGMNNMNNSLIGIMVALAFAGMGSSARGGSLDAPAGPGSAASAMFTLEDIYKVLDTHTTNVTKRTGGFTEPTSGPTSGTMHNLNDIMTLAKRAPVPKTGQTNTYWVGDDGTNRIGVAWPTQRFTAVASTGDATNQIRDNMTGLIWARNANLASNTTWATGWSSVKGTCTWYQAFDVITNSAGPVNGANGGAGYGGTNDWRLPNIFEIFSLIDFGNPSAPFLPAGHPFTYVQFVQGNTYWTSTTIANYATGPTARAWSMDLVNEVTYNGQKTYTGYVWPVRGGQ